MNQEFVSATQTIEATHPAVICFAQRHSGEAATAIELGVKLFYAVRDGFRYDPYQIDLTTEGMKASRTLELEHGWCVSKAVLLAACCRSLGISARLGFADVRNHLSTERMRQRMGTDVFYWHGYTEMLLDGKWVKATPAFNIGLCEKFGLLPLDFDGHSDSLYHPFDADGNRHMEYINLRGSYADLPLEAIIRTFRHEYGFGDRELHDSASFDEDVSVETKGKPRP